MVTRSTPASDLPELLSVEEVAAFCGIGRSLAYSLVARGELPSVRLGRLVRVPRAAILAMVEGRPHAAR